MTRAGILQRWRRWRLAQRGVFVDRTTFIHQSVSVGVGRDRYPPGAVQIGPECELGLGAELNPWGGHIRIGRRVFLGPYVVIYGQGGVDIGDHTLVAMHCCILSSNHVVAPRNRIIRNEPNVLLPTRIGTDCWLAAGVKVVGGVRIEDGCIVGAGAVVTEDLPAYSIAVGVPAKIIGYRE